MLLGEVVTVERRGDTTFVGLDIGWNVNCSYFIYKFAQEIVPVRSPLRDRTRVVTVAGHINEAERRVRRGLPVPGRRGGRGRRDPQRGRLPAGDVVDPLPAAHRDRGPPGAGGAAHEHGRGLGRGRRAGGCRTRWPARARASCSPTPGSPTCASGIRSGRRSPRGTASCATTCAGSDAPTSSSTRFSNRADLVAVMDAAGLDRAVLVGCSRAGRSSSTPRSSTPPGCRAWPGSAAGSAGSTAESTPVEDAAFEREEALEEAKDWAGDGGRSTSRCGSTASASPRDVHRPRRARRAPDGLRDLRAGEAVRGHDRPRSARHRPARPSCACRCSSIIGGLDESVDAGLGADAGRGRRPRRPADRPPGRRPHAQPRAPGVVHRDAARVPRDGRRSAAQASARSPHQVTRSTAIRMSGRSSSAWSRYCGCLSRSRATAARDSRPPSGARRSARPSMRDPAEPAPVLVPAVDEQRDLGPLERCRGRGRGRADPPSRLGLSSSGDPGTVSVGDHEAHGHEARTPVGRDGRRATPGAPAATKVRDRALEPVRASAMTAVSRRGACATAARVMKPRPRSAPRSGCRETRSRHRSEGHEPDPDQPLDPRRARDRGLRQRRTARRRRDRRGRPAPTPPPSPSPTPSPSPVPSPSASAASRPQRHPRRRPRSTRRSIPRTSSPSSTTRGSR